MAADPLALARLQRVRSGLTCLLWMFVVLELNAIFAPLRFLTGGYGSYGLNWIGMFAPLLGAIGIARIRLAVTEALQTYGSAKATAPLRVPEPTVVEPAAQKQEPAKDSVFGKTEIARQEWIPPTSAVPAAPTKREPSFFETVDWEEWIGKKLLQKVGILIVLIGMVVLLKYSFDNRLIGELGRIALSALGACALIGAGEWFSKKYALWAQAFTGGGLALLYFTVWAAHVFYKDALFVQHHLTVPPTVALILYSLITLIGALAAIRYRAQTIAWFTALGGYATPMLIDAPNTSPWTLTMYLAVLAGGMLTLAWHQKWYYLPFVAFGFTQIYLFTLVYPMAVMSNAEQIFTAIAFFVLFALPPLLYQFRLQRAAEPDDILLILFDGAAVFVAVVDALHGFGGDYVGIVSLALAAIYLAFAALALQKRSEDGTLVNTYVLASIGLIALAIYAQMEPKWVAAGWAPFSALLLPVGITLRRKSIIGCAIALLTLSLFFLIGNMPLGALAPEELWHPFTSDWAIQSYVVFASLIGWVVYAKKMPRDLLPSDEANIYLLPVLHTVIALIVFAAVTFEATGLIWSITLPLAFAYLAFAAVAVFAYASTGVVVWLAAACIAQFFVLLFTFVLGGTSGMVSPSFPGFITPNVQPFFHPWAAVSLLSIGLIGAIWYVLQKQGNDAKSTVGLSSVLIGTAAIQIWLHVTVEIQHLQAQLDWSSLFTNRVLSGWWIAFAAVLLAWAILKNWNGMLRAAIFALAIPLLKDLVLISNGTGTLYEVALWTAIPLGLILLATHYRLRELLVSANVMLAATMAVDMLQSSASSAGLLRTIWWTIVGVILISLGFAKREQLLRRFAIAIFAVTVVKLLVFDFAVLSTGVRIVASILTGLLLIGASYLYQRFDAQLTAPARKS